MDIARSTQLLILCEFSPCTHAPLTVPPPELVIPSCKFHKTVIIHPVEYLSHCTYLTVYKEVSLPNPQTVSYTRTGAVSE